LLFVLLFVLLFAATFVDAFASAAFLIASDDASPPTTIFGGVFVSAVFVGAFCNAAKTLAAVLGPYLPSGLTLIGI
jgi:hypothetical protein